MKTLLLFVLFLCASGFCMQAQNRYQIKNTVIIQNTDMDLSRLILILPVPQSDPYQTVSSFSHSNGEILTSSDPENKYLRYEISSNLPGKGDSLILSESFEVTLHPMRIDFNQFKTLYPYDTDSEIYKSCTGKSGDLVDPENAKIQHIGDSIWRHSNNQIIDYARQCYEYVAKNYSYLNPNTGLHKLTDILAAGGGDCGNLSSIYVSLLRYKKIPSRHIVTVRPDKSYHVWADFYVEKHGWIPVDVTMKLDHPEGDYFGYCLGDGIVVSKGVNLPVQFQPGEDYYAPLLQTYCLWWWKTNDGTAITGNHKVESTLLSETTSPH